MYNSEYISCPKIGFEHTLEITTKEYNAVNGSPQWDVLYPTTLYSLEELVDNLDKAHDDFLRDSRAAFETAYDDILDDEEDEKIDEPACEGCGQIIPNSCMSVATKTPLGFICGDCDLEDEPACGDCGGCCECLGDPPDCRWDTTAEMDDFYREIY